MRRRTQPVVRADFATDYRKQKTQHPLLMTRRTSRDVMASNRLWVVGHGYSVIGKRPRSRTGKLPERPGQSGTREHGLRFVERESPPASLEAPPVPRFRDRPHLLRREHRSLAQAAALAPSMYMLFRPEEEHRASREDDVLPPARGGHGEVHDRIGRDECSVTNGEPER